VHSLAGWMRWLNASTKKLGSRRMERTSSTVSEPILLRMAAKDTAIDCTGVCSVEGGGGIVSRGVWVGGRRRDVVMGGVGPIR